MDVDICMQKVKLFGVHVYTFPHVTCLLKVPLTTENIALKEKRHGMRYLLIDSDSGRMGIEQSGSS